MMSSQINYDSFINWLSKKLETVEIKFNIRKSARNRNLINNQVKGVENVLNLYSWNTSWTDKSNYVVKSDDWNSTKYSIQLLSKNIKFACNSSNTNDSEVFEACKNILEWGGERDSSKGASKFLRELEERKQLKEYLLKSKTALLINSADGPQKGEIIQMNSMLTKVHAFLSDDGLPIYDSRVAATAACLLEIYRRTKNSNASIPDKLIFPAVDGQDHKRTVSRLFPDCSNHHNLRYGQKNIAYEWARAKWNLGRVIHDVLTLNTKLFDYEGNISSRAHAVEASFFMIGYDVKCLVNN